MYRSASPARVDRQHEQADALRLSVLERVPDIGTHARATGQHTGEHFEDEAEAISSVAPHRYQQTGLPLCWIAGRLACGVEKDAIRQQLPAFQAEVDLAGGHHGHRRVEQDREVTSARTADRVRLVAEQACGAAPAERSAPDRW
jgi:hypothetical protein